MKTSNAISVTALLICGQACSWEFVDPEVPSSAIFDLRINTVQRDSTIVGSLNGLLHTGTTLDGARRSPGDEVLEILGESIQPKVMDHGAVFWLDSIDLTSGAFGQLELEAPAVEGVLSPPSATIGFIRRHPDQASHVEVVGDENLTLSLNWPASDSLLVFQSTWRLEVTATRDTAVYPPDLISATTRGRIPEEVELNNAWIRGLAISEFDVVLHCMRQYRRSSSDEQYRVVLMLTESIYWTVVIR